MDEAGLRKELEALCVGKKRAASSCARFAFPAATCVRLRLNKGSDPFKWYYWTALMRGHASKRDYDYGCSLDLLVPRAEVKAVFERYHKAS